MTYESMTTSIEASVLVNKVWQYSCNAHCMRELLLKGGPKKKATKMAQSLPDSMVVSPKETERDIAAAKKEELWENAKEHEFLD